MCMILYGNWPAPLRLFLPVLLFLSAGVCFGACKIVDSDRADLIGAWQLERIEYADGTTVTPPPGQFYGFELGGDLNIQGTAYCNWVAGSFEFTDHGEIDMAFICSRSACGISPQFCSAGATAYKYRVVSRRLILSFENPLESGLMILTPYK